MPIHGVVTSVDEWQFTQVEVQTSVQTTLSVNEWASKQPWVLTNDRPNNPKC